MISIHALRAEGDRSTTLSASTSENFYPRPPCGGRHGAKPKYKAGRRISIHALRAEGDPALLWPPDQKEISIHALRAEGDVFGHDVGLLVQRISIHALRAEGDQYPRYDRGRHTYFYPRPPCGGRRMASTLLGLSDDFYPRPPCGGRPAFAGVISLSA